MLCTNDGHARGARDDDHGVLTTLDGGHNDDGEHRATIKEGAAYQIRERDELERDELESLKRGRKGGARSAVGDYGGGGGRSGCMARVWG